MYSVKENNLQQPNNDHEGTVYTMYMCDYDGGVVMMMMKSFRFSPESHQGFFFFPKQIKTMLGA